MNVPGTELLGLNSVERRDDAPGLKFNSIRSVSEVLRNRSFPH